MSCKIKNRRKTTAEKRICSLCVDYVWMRYCQAIKLKA